MLDVETGPPAAPAKRDAARVHLQGWLVLQAEEIARLEPVVRGGEPGGVHGTRQACRRLRAGLATYRPLVERARTDPVREELRWLARSLGRARDDEVVVARIAARLEAEVDDGPVAPARALLEEYAAGRAAEDRVDVAVALDSARYVELRGALDALRDRPAWTAEAERPAREVLPGLVRREWRRVRRVRRDSTDSHEVRRAVKRLRYALELVEPAWGERAARPRRAARDLTQVLGDAQDSVVAREWLTVLSAEAARTGVPTFSLGRVHALEEQREVEALLEAKAVWIDLAQALRRW